MYGTYERVKNKEDKYSRNGRNTSFFYIYRDSLGVESYGRVVVRGRIERKDIEMLLPGGKFIPEALGIRPLRSDLGEGFDSSPWHEFLDARPTHEEASLDCDIDAEELLGRLEALEGEGWKREAREWNAKKLLAREFPGVRVFKDFDGTMFAVSAGLEM